MLISCAPKCAFGFNAHLLLITRQCFSLSLILMHYGKINLKWSLTRTWIIIMMDTKLGRADMRFNIVCERAEIDSNSEVFKTTKFYVNICFSLHLPANQPASLIWKWARHCFQCDRSIKWKCWLSTTTTKITNSKNFCSFKHLTHLTAIIWKVVDWEIIKAPIQSMIELLKCFHMADTPGQFAWVELFIEITATESGARETFLHPKCLHKVFFSSQNFSSHNSELKNSKCYWKCGQMCYPNEIIPFIKECNEIIQLQMGCWIEWPPRHA